jgi:pyruvate dehydrogenase E2 component (dihydrolipoamide acetyltransferase)
MALIEVKVPDIGDFKDVQVIEVLVKPGDTIKAEQSLVTVESDKASMEIPSTHAGVVKELKVKLGDKVSEGSLLLMLEGAEVASPPPPPAPAPSAPSAPTPASAPPPPAPATPAVPAAPSSGGGGFVEVRVPDIGDFKDVAVIEVMIKPGDTIEDEQSLITVESDKASMEIPASHAGVVKEVKVKVGDRINQGSPIAIVEARGFAPVSLSEAADAPAGMTMSAIGKATVDVPVAAPPPARHSPTEALPPEPPAPLGTLPHASPSVRRYARELGVPLDEVQGSGPKGRITQDDVQAFVKRVMSGDVRTQAAGKAPAAQAAGALPGLLPWPQVDFAKFGPIERQPLSRIKKISGANLHRNWVMIPHVTNHEDADITELEAFRLQLNKEYEKSGVKVTMLAFLVKACVAALKKFPQFNASLEGQGDDAQLVLKQYFHIGFAADTPNGLVVPVIKDADKKGIVAIAKEMSELAGKAREGKLSPTEMSGGCFSISSLGGIGGTYFTPIINAPEVAILGVCKSSMKPVWDGKAFVPRLILPLSLSWDHRVVDGASAARFNTYLAAVLADFRRVML